MINLSHSSTPLFNLKEYMHCGSNKHILHRFIELCFHPVTNIFNISFIHNIQLP